MESSLQAFSNLSSDPVSFLNGNSGCSNDFISISSSLYSIIKHNDEEIDDPSLKQLFTDGMDIEQVWQQMELYNNSRSSVFRDLAVVYKQSSATAIDDDMEDDDVDSAAEADDDDESSNASKDEQQADDSDDYNSDADETHKVDENFEKTSVDDNFFSLRQMEKFLDNEENKMTSNDDEGIDYFEDIPSDEDEGDISGLSDDADDDDEMKSTNDEDNISLIDHDDDTSLNDQEKQSARQMKYEDFFSNQQEKEVTDRAQTTQSKHHESDINPESKKSDNLVDQALAEPNWQMKGETTGDKRPVNSLLQEVLAFDQVERQAPDITDEHTMTLEETIKQRIKDQAFDDVVRKIKDTRDPLNFKKTVVLNSEKSQLSLHEIYEKEYLKNKNKDVEDKENPEHAELKVLMTNVFRKLDALSNFHFKNAPPEPEIKIISNLPAMNIEDVQPVMHSDAKALAPEEILEKKDLISKDELTTEDRHRRRRKKKLQMKARAQNRQKKLEALADTNEKLQKLQAVNQLKKSAKLQDSRTTLIGDGKGNNKISSSKSFFKQLQETKGNKKSLERKPVARKT